MEETVEDQHLSTVLLGLLFMGGCAAALWLIVRFFLRRATPRASWDELVADAQAGYYRRMPADYATCSCEREKGRRSKPPCPGCIHETEAQT